MSLGDGAPLQLYSIHAYYYRSVLGGMRVHFNLLGWHVCILYIAYHEYSMIDPSGTMISGTCCCELATFALLCGSVTGFCGLRAKGFEVYLFWLLSVYSFRPNSTFVGPFTRCLNMLVLWI